MKKQITVKEKNESEGETFNYVIYVTPEEENQIREKCEKYGGGNLTVQESNYTDEEIKKMCAASSNEYMNFIAPYELKENALKNWKEFGDCFYKGAGLTKLKDLAKKQDKPLIQNECYPRYFVDIRVGCGAVRDSHLTQYDIDYEKLKDEPDVVEHRDGHLTELGWQMRQEDIDYLEDLCHRLNGKYAETESIMDIDRLRWDVMRWVNDPQRRLPMWMANYHDSLIALRWVKRARNVISAQSELDATSLFEIASIIGVNPDEYFYFEKQIIQEEEE